MLALMVTCACNGKASTSNANIRECLLNIFIFHPVCHFETKFAATQRKNSLSAVTKTLIAKSKILRFTQDDIHS